MPKKSQLVNGLDVSSVSLSLRDSVWNAVRAKLPTGQEEIRSWHIDYDPYVRAVLVRYTRLMYADGSFNAGDIVSSIVSAHDDRINLARRAIRHDQRMESRNG